MFDHANPRFFTGARVSLETLSRGSIGARDSELHGILRKSGKIPRIVKTNRVGPIMESCQHAIGGAGEGVGATDGLLYPSRPLGASVLA